ncbi:MAG: MFS transporter, partial [Ktedonobacteraceae bacterium]|nr:MFS transporter [Ktedonobacteraceae bacterium]
SIGFILAIRQLLQQGSTPISGVIADHIGPKRLICLGLLLRVFSFACMALADNFPLLLFSAILTGLAGSLFDAPLAATITTLTDAKQRSRFYSLCGVSTELGGVIGIQLGVILLSFNFEFTTLGAAACFGAASLLTLIFMPSIRITGQRDRVTEGLGLALRDLRFVLYTLLLFGFWFMWVQLTISLPLAVTEIGASNETLGLLYGISSGISICLGYPLLHLFSRRCSSFTLLIGGMALMAIGFGAIALFHNVALLGVCVVIVTIGVLLAMPSQRTVAAQLAHPEWLGSYLGLNAIAQGVGGALGNYSGGLLHDVGKQIHFTALPWLVFFLVGILATSGLWLLAHYRPAKEAKT